MKKIMILLFTAITVTGFSQNRMMKAVYSDPAVENLQITDKSNGALNTDLLETGRPVKVQFTMLNNDAVNEIPAGSLQLKITLGTRFTLSTDILNQQELPLRSYFNWVIRQAATSKQYILTGTLHRDLPARFSGNISFMLMPSRTGASTLVCQLLVSNDKNTSSVLSDQAPANNYLSMSYTNVKPLDIKFIRFDATPRACVADLSWAIYDEAKEAKRFVIESSDNGTTFTPVQTLPVGAEAGYSYLLQTMLSQGLTVRIKAEAANGQFVYSDPKSANITCKNDLEIFLYPNPIAADITEVTLRAKTGIFNGKYNIRINDVGGSEMKRLEAIYSNQVQVRLQTGKLPAGTYFIVLTGEDGKQVTLKMVRL